MSNKAVNKLKTLSILIISILIVTLLGCGKPKETKAPTSKEPLNEVDFLTVNWQAAPKEPAEVSGWDVVEYIPDISTPTDESSNLFINKVILGKDAFYSLLLCDKQDGEEVYCKYELKKTDINSMETSSVYESLSELDFGDLWDKAYISQIDEALKHGKAEICSVDTSEEGVVFLVNTYDEDGYFTHIYALTLSEDRKIEKINDYVDFFSKRNRNNGLYPPEIICSKDGTSVFLDNEGKILYVLDGNGAILSSVNLSEEKIKSLRSIGKNVDGTPIFMAKPSGDTAEFMYFDESGKHILLKCSMEIDVCSVDRYGNVFILSGTRLKRWNVATGEFSQIYSFTGLSSVSCMGIETNSAGDIFVYYHDRQESFLYRLNDEEHPDSKELVLLKTRVDNYLESCAAEYSRSHPGITITVEALESNDEISKVKLLNQIKEGEGPDLIFTDRNFLLNLESAGVAYPLDGVISQETLKNVFKGSLAVGIIEEKLYAVPMEGAVTVLMVNKDYWDKPSWTQREALEAYEKWKKTSNGSRFLSVGYDLRPQHLFITLMNRVVEHSEYVDFDTLTCSFETKNFYDLLEFCKENCDTTSNNINIYSTDEQIKQSLNNEAFLNIISGNFITFSRDMSKFGDSFRPVGFPSNDGIESVVESYLCLCVNSLSNNKEIAADFIEAVLSEYYQKKYGTEWINKEILLNNVLNSWEVPKVDGYEDKYTGKPAFISIGGYVPLEGKSDGSTYVNEFIELMDKGVPVSTEYDIQSILIEETAPFFEGQKTAQEVAKIIQKRVQILLDERK